jgi:stage II sporulation protein D
MGKGRSLRALKKGTLAGALALLLVASGLAPTAMAVVTTTERVTLPAAGSVSIAGRGYGHGIGMSQYGARAAAASGVGYQAILDFYYPGTGRATLADAAIRVLLSADTDDDLRVVGTAGLTVTDGSGAVRSLTIAGASVSQWRVVRNSSGMQISGLVAGTWRTWSPTVLRSPVTISSPTGVVRHVRSDGGIREYRGSLRAVDDGAAPNLRSVNVVPMESYLRSVVPAESPASWPAHALRAQAVAARSYAALERSSASARAWDTCDTTSCQVYAGYRTLTAAGVVQTTHEHPNTDAAVTATAGGVRTYGGLPAFTQFSSSNGGWTARGSKPYLVAKRDPWDEMGNPNHQWNVTVNVAQIRSGFPSVGTPRSLVVTTRTGEGEWAGRVESVTVAGSSASTTVTGAQFRFALGLKSDWWKITGSSRLDTDFTAQGRADLFARTPDGQMMVYEANGLGGFASGPRYVGRGWEAMRLIERAGDLTGDGNADLLAVDQQGILWVYRTNGSGGVGARTRVGGGWDAMRYIAAPGDLNSDGKADLVAISSLGQLVFYAGRGDGTFDHRGSVSANWLPMTALLGAGDLTGDGISDLLARHEDGRLLLYAGNGRGGVHEARLLGRNWQDMRYLTVSGDWSGDGRPDVLAARADGVLYLYTWTGGPNVNAGLPISRGWQAYDLLR